MIKRLKDYREGLLKDLQDPEAASMYLNEALKDEDPRMFLLALKNIREAQGLDVSELARVTQMSRQSLYKILSTQGNPKLDSLSAILHALGLQIAVEPIDIKRRIG